MPLERCESELGGERVLSDTVVMGSIDIPANPSAPGHVSVRLSLDATQMQSLSSLLQQAVHLVQTTSAGLGIRYECQSTAGFRDPDNM